MLENQIEKDVKVLKYEWNHYKTILFIIVIILTLELYLTGYLEYFLGSLGNYGYLGGLISGFLYTFGVSTPFAVASFFILAQSLNMWLLIILGSLGGLLSEYIMYNFVKCETVEICKKRKIKLKVSSNFKKLSYLMAGLIIATPIPDEFVAVLFGIENFRLRDFLILTFVSKFIGIFFIVFLGEIF